MTAQEDVLGSYRPRETNFIISEVSPELGDKYAEQPNRPKITQKDLGDTSIIGSLATVQYGTWGSEPACLTAFRFQFQTHDTEILRISKSKITIQYEAHPTSEPDDDPAILDYGPKSLRSEGTPVEVTRHWTVSFSAKGSVGPVQVGPDIEGGREKTFTQRIAASVESDDWGNSKHQYPNCVWVRVRADKMQPDGIPLELRVAVVVKMGDAAQATVKVTTDSALFNMLTWPWEKKKPLLLKRGIDYGALVRKAEGKPLDFASLTVEEWRALVTPDLKQREAIHHRQPPGIVSEED